MTNAADGPETGKAEIRARIKAARAARPEGERREEDRRRAAALVEHLLTLQPRVVAAYLSTGEEPDLGQVVRELSARGIRVLLPVLGRRDDGTVRREPDWAVWDGPEATRVGIWGISEPTTTPLGARGLLAADVVLCSALAATRAGERLGMGGGWYDRALAHKREDAPVIACLNASEVLAALPTQEWDRRVDALATGEGVVAAG